LEENEGGGKGLMRPIRAKEGKARSGGQKKLGGKTWEDLGMRNARINLFRGIFISKKRLSTGGS